MSNRNAIVLVRPQADGYSDYIKYVKPYLDHFGIPYVEAESYSGEDCAVIIAAHSGVQLNEKVVDAVKAGTGLVCFGADTLPEEFSAVCQTGIGTSACFSKADHYISKAHFMGERIPFYGELSVSCGKGLANADTLVSSDGVPLMQVSRDMKIVLWRSVLWASHDVLGPIHGMDDLVWRGIDN